MYIYTYMYVSMCVGVVSMSAIFTYEDFAGSVSISSTRSLEIN